MKLDLIISFYIDISFSRLMIENHFKRIMLFMILNKKLMFNEIKYKPSLLCIYLLRQFIGYKLFFLELKYGLIKYKEDKHNYNLLMQYFITNSEMYMNIIYFLWDMEKYFGFDKKDTIIFFIDMIDVNFIDIFDIFDIFHIILII